MYRYYDVTLLNKKNNVSISYWADSFSIDKYGILRLKSEECGNITVQIEADEQVTVCTIDVLDEGEEMLLLEEKAEEINQTKDVQ